MRPNQYATGHLDIYPPIPTTPVPGRSGCYPDAALGMPADPYRNQLHTRDDMIVVSDDKLQLRRFPRSDQQLAAFDEALDDR